MGLIDRLFGKNDLEEPKQGPVYKGKLIQYRIKI
jgi:hypothetical protein